MKYYPINESTAKTANDINSFSNYQEGSATAGYMAVVDKAYNLLDRITAARPEAAEKAAYMVDRYSRKYAEYLNDYYRNEAACPSVLICGPANFPVKKKERQNSRRDTLNGTFKYLQEYYRKIENLLYNTAPILSGDADAIERLKDKIADLEETKSMMIDLNKYFRKNGSVEGYEKEIPAALMKHIDFMVSHGWARNGLFDTSNTNQELNRLKKRLSDLEAAKEAGNSEETVTAGDGTDLFQIVRDSEIMRLQLIFDGKPDDATREVLKSNGFKWAPSNQAWQRLLNTNSEYALQRVIKALA